MIILINVYRVNAGHSNIGKYTNCKQQVFIKLKEGVISTIQSIKPSQNYAEKRKKTFIHTMTQKLGLIYLAATLPEKHKSRENGRLIDHCLVRLSVLSSVYAFGYLLYDKITKSPQQIIISQISKFRTFLPTNQTKPPPYTPGI